jgi:hypothetical protein
MTYRELVIEVHVGQFVRRWAHACQVKDPGCGVEDGQCVSMLPDALMGATMVLLVCLVVAGGAYLHARRARVLRAGAPAARCWPLLPCSRS